VELKPDFAIAYGNRGILLAQRGRPAEAEAALRKAVELDPDDAVGHGNLGLLMRDQGRFDDALAAFRRAHDLVRQRRPDMTGRAAQLVRETERLVALDAKLPAVLKGEVAPASAAERFVYADLCHHKRLFAAAARLSADAFAADPKLSDVMPAYRYNAACAAALAGSGQGTDAPPEGAERARLRRQALDWLRAELVTLIWGLADGPAETAKEVIVQLRHWQQDSDFAGVRGDDALAKLPADERAAWQKLWADVADLLAKSEAAK
jgi:tetratricopeptide (TPR) repeat protein